MIQKVALIVLLFAVAAGLISVLSKGAALVRGQYDGPVDQNGGSMQRLTFFLLLALIAYVAASGAS